MKTQFSLFRTALSFIVLTAPVFAHGQSSEMPGFLSDYHYQVTNLSSYAEAQALMDTEAPETGNKSICGNRAQVWAYIMNQRKAVQIGKVFIHFTAKGQADENKEWSFHVAPYVMVNGEEVVLDRAFAAFNQKPTPLSNWTNYFGKSTKCVVLDPLHNPTHMNLEHNNLPNDQVDPISYKRGGARQYPSTEGICYIRKVPMYYAFPIDVYGADLALSGQSRFNSYLKSSFSKSDVLDSCKQAMTTSFRMSQSCAKYLGIE